MGNQDKAPRWIVSRPALFILEQVFALEKFPTMLMRTRLATDLGVTPRQVQIWFQNRRQRERNLRKQGLLDDSPAQSSNSLNSSEPADLAFDVAAPPPLLTFADHDATSGFLSTPDQIMQALEARDDPPRSNASDTSSNLDLASAPSSPPRLDSLAAPSGGMSGMPHLPPLDEGHTEPAASSSSFMSPTPAHPSMPTAHPGMPATMTAATTLPALAAFRELSALTAAHAQAAQQQLPPAHPLSSASQLPMMAVSAAARALPAQGGGAAAAGPSAAAPDATSLALASLTAGYLREVEHVFQKARGLGVGASAGAAGAADASGGRAPSPAPIAAAAGVAPAMMPVARAYPVGGDDVTMAHEAHAAQMAQFGLQPFPTFNTMGAVAQHLGGYPARHHAQPSNPHSVAPQIVQFAQRHGLHNRGHAAAPTPTAYPPMAAPAPFSQAAPAPAQHPFGFGRGLDSTPHPGLAPQQPPAPPMTKLDGATVGGILSAFTSDEVHNLLQQLGGGDDATGATAAAAAGALDGADALKGDVAAAAANGVVVP